jgi:hypothetical protein
LRPGAAWRARSHQARALWYKLSLMIPFRTQPRRVPGSKRVLRGWLI